ncbi:MAG: TolC family protein [Burkholderiaceae bacterium]|nr:TolC family protein [Burkholderiaceae bacterium]
MKYPLHACALAVAIALAAPAMAASADALPGGSVESLLDYARERNPEFAAMRLEAEAASERAAAAGSLPDPKLQIEWRDITKMNTQNPTLAPSRVGTTRYQIMQDVPWFGKRGLQRDIAQMEAEGAKGLSYGTWAELSSRIKASYAQYYAVHQTEGLAREILDLMARLEKVTQVRYAGGLAAQQDAIRAQVEQTNLKNELIALENEKRMLQSRLNMLLARPAQAPLAAPDQLRPLPQPVKLDYAALAERVRARNPRLFAEESRLKAAEKNRDLVYKNRYPDFAVGVAPMQTGGSVKEWEVMFQMTIPLQQAPRRAQEREAQAMLAAAQSRKDATANQVLAELSENLSALEAARRTETLVANSLLPQAELTYRAALASYENGKVDFATLLDAQRQIRLAKQNRFKAQADAQARLAEIERLLGEEL